MLETQGSTDSSMSMHSSQSDSIQARLSELSPKELAECLTYIESALFLNIRPTDCVAFIKKLEGDATAVITALQRKNDQVRVGSHIPHQYDSELSSYA